MARSRMLLVTIPFSQRTRSSPLSTSLACQLMSKKPQVPSSARNSAGVLPNDTGVSAPRYGPRAAPPAVSLSCNVVTLIQTFDYSGERLDAGRVGRDPCVRLREQRVPEALR